MFLLLYLIEKKKSNRERILFQEWQDSRKVSSQDTNESLEGKLIDQIYQGYLNQ